MGNRKRLTREGQLKTAVYFGDFTGVLTYGNGSSILDLSLGLKGDIMVRQLPSAAKTLFDVMGKIVTDLFGHEVDADVLVRRPGDIIIADGSLLGSIKIHSYPAADLVRNVGRQNGGIKLDVRGVSR